MKYGREEIQLQSYLALDMRFW